MYITLKKYIDQIIELNNIQYSDIELISGWSTWIDHLAILLYFEYYYLGIKLTLYLQTESYKDTFKEDNPNKLLNILHNNFSKKCNINSIEQINKAIKLGAQYKIYNGFFERNTYVAKTDMMIAFTFGKDKPSSSGTKDTWNKFKYSNKVHFYIYIK